MCDHIKRKVFLVIDVIPWIAWTNTYVQMHKFLLSIAIEISTDLATKQGRMPSSITDCVTRILNFDAIFNALGKFYCPLYYYFIVLMEGL